MAFAVKYHAEFTDINSADWQVDIEEDGYGGTTSIIQTTGDPLNIEYLTASDDLLATPIKGSIAKLNIECDTNFQYVDLYSYADMTFRMKVYCDSVLYWQGWVSTDYTEPYDTPPYTVSINAADGLGLLKNIEYKDTTEYYTGREIESVILLDILNKIGYTTFTEFVNIYEDRLDDGVGDSVFTQILIDRSVFEGMSCYDVLAEILKKYNAIIRQWGGAFMIYRPYEFLEDTVYGRVITSASVTATSITPDQELRTDELTDSNGGVMMFKSPISKFTGEQDYGNRESWLENHKFDIKTWDTNDEFPDKFEEWIHFGVMPAGFEYKLRNEVEGIIIAADGTGYTYYCYQRFGYLAKACTDVFILSFDYLYINANASEQTDVTFNITLGDVADNYYLNQTGDGVAEFQAGYHTVDILADIAPGAGSWNSVTYQIPGIPVGGPFIINLHTSDNANVRVAYKNIRFYSTSDNVVINTKKVRRFTEWYFKLVPTYWMMRLLGMDKKSIKESVTTDNEEVVSRLYTSTNAINAPERGEGYLLGDCTDTNLTNVIEQFRGALAIQSTGSLSSSATDFVVAYAADYAALVSPGVILTSNSFILYFESDTPGTNFTGATSIVNASGDLTGNVVTLQANVTAVARRDEIELTGTNGEVYITCNGLERWLEFTTSIDITGAAFVTNHAAAYLAIGVVVTYSNALNSLIFVANVAGENFTGSTTCVNDSGDFDGIVSLITPNTTAKARKDEIILSGTSGTATITCHGEANTVTFNVANAVDYTVSWHTRGNTEADEVLQIVSDEMTDIYSQGRQFIQLPFMENTDTPAFTMIGNVQDPLNLNGVNNRVFVPVRGDFNVRRREWTIDMIEIGDK